MEYLIKMSFVLFQVIIAKLALRLLNAEWQIHFPIEYSVRAFIFSLNFFFIFIVPRLLTILPLNQFAIGRLTNQRHYDSFRIEFVL